MAKSSIAASWKKLDAARGSTSPKPATAAAIAKLEKQVGALPGELAESLAIHDGGVHLDSYEMLPAKQIATWTRSARELVANVVAVAADSGGNVYALDKRGRLIGVERQGPQGTFVKAKSLGAWLASLVAALDAETHVADDGGIVEKVLAPSVPASQAGTQRIEAPLADKVFAMIDGGDVKGLTKLLDAKQVEPSAHFWTDESLLAHAAGERKLAIVKLLLARGCPVDIGKETGERTALFTACWGVADGTAVVELLLESGADPNAQTGYDGTPLHSAIMWEHPDLVKRLVKAGADPKKTDAKGTTAIAAAKQVKGAKRKALVDALG